MKLSTFVICVLALFHQGSLRAADPADVKSAAPAKTAKAGPQPTPDKNAVALYSLDYDDVKDVFYTPHTKQPYNGPVFSKYDNGMLESIGTLKNGHEEGLWTDYYENGNKTSEGVYHDGHEEGEWTYWHENGQISSKGSYKAGSTEGKWFEYFENGKPDSEGVYVDGVMDGPWKYYDEETGAVTIVKFDRGVQLKP